MSTPAPSTKQKASVVDPVISALPTEGGAKTSTVAHPMSSSAIVEKPVLVSLAQPAALPVVAAPAVVATAKRVPASSAVKPVVIVPPAGLAPTKANAVPTAVVRKQAMSTGVPAAVSSAPPVPVAASTKSKSKKKKQSAVTMATTSNAQGGGGAGENTGRWTAEEHRLFLQGLEQHGKGWKKIASLIKSRTVVQIRTHAQKYFQKLAKARQNGEEGDVAMDPRGGAAAVAVGLSTSTANNKRRRQTTGTKRKAITSVVESAMREGKRQQSAQISAGVPCPVPPLPAVAPALAPFLMPSAQSQTGATTPTTLPASAHGAIAGPALEDSLFRFLTPAPVPAADYTPQVNDVARQAGANPITLPTDNPSTAPSISGEVSPTGVTDVAIFPSWTDAKDMPSWYAKGADVDVLLEAADGLDWLTDTGDLHETYEPPAGAVINKASPVVSVPIPASIAAPAPLSSENDLDANDLMKATSVTNLTTAALGSDGTVDVPPLPSLFESSENVAKKIKPSLSTSVSAAEIDESLNVFDTPMEEHAFVSALLENNGESTNSLPALQEG